ncbi:Tether containing UBX domain for GLUT4 [Verticillium longisporum]|uniref:Tether containing UBX domain for GLUT4 n=2 Tax=Verticillium longisporum TaxID=100787 RepID=A0A0G4M4E0_VERLO|nr:Tether containing UBX domain for GLUT4 [Verticillium longisporum]KAG7127508.1 Tether containing UBX domain for GLUT4 [Verticillium longisporum]CRK29134.1 hypothetical protein BN1708_015484 [Verticillium longisporum]
MASHVTVIATDLRRTTVKVNPGTYMTDVLQEACKKLNLSSDKYLLKHKQKQVDLSVLWRQAGLIPGAKLELVQKSNTPSAVSVALQLPSPESNATPNGRVVDKFSSESSLWKVLRQFETRVSSQGKNLNLTARGVAQTTAGGQTGSGQLFYETPVLNIMGRELASFVDFQKTLSQLGYNSGSVLIRLSFRKTDKTLFESMTEISQFFADVEAEEKEAAAVPATTATVPETVAQPEPDSTAEQSTEPQVASIPEPASAQPEQTPSGAMDVDPAPITLPSDPLQPVGVFQAPIGTTIAAASMPMSESDFTPSIQQAQLHQARLLQSSHNKRLPSDKEIEEKAQAEEAKLASVSSVPVKVRFPDNTSAQWVFGPEATGAVLYEAVRSVMANGGQKFRLVLPGGKDVVKDSRGPNTLLIHDYKMTRSVLVNFVWDDSVPGDVRKQAFLKGSVAQRATAVKVPELPKEQEVDDRAPVVPSSKPEGSDRGDGGAGKKLPKWLKLPGKK